MCSVFPCVTRCMRCRYVLRVLGKTGEPVPNQVLRYGDHIRPWDARLVVVVAHALSRQVSVCCPTSAHR